MTFRPASTLARWTLIPATMLLVLTLAGPARPARADDGCDPSEAIACLPPPLDDPGTPEARPAPSAAAPLPPRPCPPILATEAAPGVAAPIPAPRGCNVGEIIATVNRANAIYARALRSLDSRELTSAWGDEALADLLGQIASLRSEGAYATPQLLSITLREVLPGAQSASVRTIEHWIYQVRSRFNGGVIVEQDEWVENVYSLSFRGGRWLVVRDVITLVPPPVTVQTVSARVTADRDLYNAGETVTATVTNDGQVALSPVGGFGCGIVALEWFGPGGWQRAPIPEPLMPCTAIAVIVAPGQSRTQPLPAGGPPGIYRVAFSYVPQTPGARPPDNGPRAAYSAPFVVR